MKLVATVNFFSFYHHYKIVLICGLIVFLGPKKLLAQTDTTQHLKEVKVLSTPIPKVKTPVPAQQVSASDFKRYNANSVADAVRNFSGVNIKDYGGIGGLKTVSVRSLGDNHTGVLYDGIQLNDAQNGQVDLGKLSLDNVQEITLYNGQPAEICQSARAYSFASVLSIKTIRPELNPNKPYQITATMKGGSFGLINPSLQWQQKIAKNWSIAVNGNWQNANGRYKYKVEGDGSDTLALRKNADITALQTDASLFWNKNDSNKFSLRINYYNSEQGLPGAIIFYNSYSSQRLWNTDVNLQAGYDRKWVNGFRLLLNTKASQNYIRYLDPDYLNQQGKLDQRYTEHEYYQSAALSYKVYPNLELSYASDISFNDLNTNQTNYAYPVRFTWLNVFAGALKLGRFNIQGNILNTRINEWVKKGKAASPKSLYSPTLMLTVEPFKDSDFQIRAFYKDIYRNPTFNDLYYTRIGTRTLKPEFAEQYNIGFTFSKAFTAILDYAAITTDVYYNNIKDKIIAIPNKDLNTWSMFNLGKVDIRGLDVSFKTQIPLNENWKVLLSGNYTYQEALDVTDYKSSVYLNQIPYTPKHTLAINTGINNKRVSLYYNQIYSSSRYYLSQNLPEYFVPGFLISDVSLTYKFSLNKFPATASAEINNLFNKSYAIIRSFPMPGRSVRFTFQITI